MRHSYFLLSRGDSLFPPPKPRAGINSPSTTGRGEHGELEGPPQPVREKQFPSSWSADASLGDMRKWLRKKPSERAPSALRESFSHSSHPPAASLLQKAARSCLLWQVVNGQWVPERELRHGQEGSQVQPVTASLRLPIYTMTLGCCPYQCTSCWPSTNRLGSRSTLWSCLVDVSLFSTWESSPQLEGTCFRFGSQINIFQRHTDKLSTTINLFYPYLIKLLFCTSLLVTVDQGDLTGLKEVSFFFN